MLGSIFEIMALMVLGSLALGAIAVFFIKPDETTKNAWMLGISSHDIIKHGRPNPQLVCPHCQSKGKVLTKPVTRKAGLSGGKTSAAILTGGVSIVATGLSRKESVTEAHCANCSSTWHY